MLTRCSVCNRRFGGRIRRWAGRTMCKSCYSHFCNNYRLSGRPKQERKTGFWDWLFR